MPQFPFNPQQFQLQTTLERLPRGWYPAVITSSEIVETSNKDGFRLKVEFQIIDGPYKGRKVQNGYNIQNNNAQTVEIAMKEIKTICTCVGIFAPINQTEELHNKPLQILLTEPKDSDYNAVKGYKDINGTDPDKIGAGGPPMGHMQQPPQGYGQPPQQAYAPPQAAPAYGAPQQQPAYGAPPPAAAPAWAPPPQQAQQQAPAPAYAPPQQQQAPAAPAWQPGPQAAAPQAPAWAPQR